MIAAPKAMTEPLKKARNVGFHVVATNVDPKAGVSGSREAYVGQDFETAGELIAKRIIKDGGLKTGAIVFDASRPEGCAYSSLHIAGC